MLKQRIVLEYDENSPYGLRIERKYLLEHRDAVIAAMKADFKFEEGQTFYYLPDVNIPRFKLKLFTDKANAKSTMSTEKADYIFIGSIPNSRHVNSLTNKEVTYQSYKKINDILGNNFINTLRTVPEFLPVYDQLLKDFEMFDIIFSNETMAKMDKFLRDKLHKYIWFGYGYDNLNFISLKSPKLISKLRFESELLSLLNEDSVVITDEKQKELQAMFDSKQDDNIILAMEIMANSNYEESILNNYMLLITNLGIIASYKESGHRNFQSFLMFYGLDIRNLSSRIRNIDVDYMAGFLKDYGRLTAENMEKLLLWYNDANNQYIGNFCNSVLVGNSTNEYDGE
jgi:hypothetical protein